jgi:small subunit ribosomal protein S21
MLIIEVKNGNIEQALKKYKSKVFKTKQILKLRDRKEFTKKSVANRATTKKAKYIQALKSQYEKES